jgi:type I restriction enzyme, S subunit
MNKYPTYKPSNIDWIGEIPSHWLLVKTGHYTYIVRGASPRPAGEPSLFDGDFIHWITVKEVTNGLGKFVTSTETYLTEEGMKQSRVVEPETLVISNSGATLGVPKILKIRGCINDGSVAFLNLKENLFRDYLYYFIFSQTELLREQQSGYGQPNLNTDIIANIKFPLPPLQEQQAIVSYLDEKTALIDELILKKERKIELLKEQRAALINQAVTKGLYKDVPMKDSHIEWIGVVPEHWSCVKVGHYTYIIRGASPRPAGDPELFDGDFISWITVKEVTNSVGKYVTSTESYLTEAGMKQSRIIEPETLVLSNSGATLGVPKILKIQGCINDGSVAFLYLSIRLERDFLYYFFISQTELLREQQSGYGQPNLNTDIISNIKFPLPPLSEQKSIVAYLDEQTTLMDKSIALESQKIDKLKEYRQSLISNVVTGKVKVIE